MKTTTEIINAYAHGELTLVECNAKLAAIGSKLMLDPNLCKLTPEMIADGWGLLDTGTGSLDPVQVKNMELVNADCGEMEALCILNGKMYAVHGKKLSEI